MLRKSLSILLCLVLVLGAVSAFAQTVTGEAEGFKGKVKVTVTVENGKIVDVKAEAPDDTPGISDPALSEVPARMVEANSADVDVAAGATYTSKGVIEAVKAALLTLPTETKEEAPAAPAGAVVLTGEAEGFKGKVMVTVTVENGKIVDVKAEAPDDTPGISDPALSEVPARMVEANSADVDVAAGATYTSKGVIEAVKAALLTLPTETKEEAPAAPAGAVVLTGEAEGFKGKVMVTVTVENGKIVDVKAEAPDDTPGISDPALSEVPARIVEANSADVDVAAGATYTSKGVIEAVKAALLTQPTETKEEAPAVAQPEGALPEGAVEVVGEADGFMGKVQVTLLVDAQGNLLDVKVYAPEDAASEAGDDAPQVAATALVDLPRIMKEANTVDIDLITGATETSDGFIKAAKAAMGKVEAARQALSAPKAPEGEAAAQGAVVLTGEAEGFKGKVKVTVTVENGKIVDVKAEAPDDTPGISDPALSEVPARIVEANSADVDVAAGATYTSKGVIEAVKAALLTQSKTEETKPAPEGEVKSYTAKAQGMHGPIEVAFETTGGKITKVDILSHDEHPDFGLPAIQALPQRIVDKGDTQVDVIGGSTVTSKAILKAINETLNPPPAAPGAFLGLGMDSVGRVGPGKDDKEVQVYSINQVFAAVLFDTQGHITYARLDQLEVATPNYDGAGMPHFAGFPGQLPYLYDSDHDGKVDGVLETNDEHFQEEITKWQTKRQRGEEYKLSTGTWASQMDAYENFFVGKTVDELEAWFKAYTSDRNGRPLKDGNKNEEDKAKYDALSDEDKAMLADVTSSATMSLNDAHGNILAALRRAYDNRVKVNAPAASLGLGLNFTGRIGPGKDNTETQVYSVNEIAAVTLFDAEGKMVQTLVDQIEFATPNYDGAGMPDFSGFPGQGGYNYDANHDGVVDGRKVTNADGFLSEVQAFRTKRDRGNDYKLSSGTWASEMDAFQAFFAGKTLDELDQWVAKYTSDRNGRPLKDGSKNEEDKAKYDALSAQEKHMLSDVTSGATMSLNDAHGNILAALRDSFNNKVDHEVTVK